MNLYLLRHGAAEMRWDCRDSERALTELGYRQAETAGHWLRREGVRFTHTVTSGYTRAVQTAQAVLAVCGGAGVTELTFREFSPGGDPNVMIPVLAALPDDATVLAVGHMPSIHLLAAALSPDFPGDRSFGNCTLAFFTGKPDNLSFQSHRYNEEMTHS